MNIFIGKYEGNKVLGLILAKDKDVAWTYFQAKYNEVSNVEEIDIKELSNLGNTPYFQLIETYERPDFSNNFHRFIKDR